MSWSWKKPNETADARQWFVERGFRNAPIDDLPPSKRAGYDLSRSSKAPLLGVSLIPPGVHQERLRLAQ